MPYLPLDPRPTAEEVADALRRGAQRFAKASDQLCVSINDAAAGFRKLAQALGHIDPRKLRL